jgi:hypothetical protein
MFGRPRSRHPTPHFERQLPARCRPHLAQTRIWWFAAVRTQRANVLDVPPKPRYVNEELGVPLRPVATSFVASEPYAWVPLRESLDHDFHPSLACPYSLRPSCTSGQFGPPAPTSRSSYPQVARKPGIRSFGSVVRFTTRRRSHERGASRCGRALLDSRRDLLRNAGMTRPAAKPRAAGPA